jgi:hypothetical protein
VYFKVTVSYEDGQTTTEVLSITLAPYGTTPPQGPNFNDHLLKRPNWLWLILALCSLVVAGLIALIIWLLNREQDPTNPRKRRDLSGPIARMQASIEQMREYRRQRKAAKEAAAKAAEL